VVWTFKGRPAPLTHRLTLVEFPEGNFIADVGFGGQTGSTFKLRIGLRRLTRTHSPRTLSSAEPWARLGSIWSTQTAPFGTLTDMWSHPPWRTPVNWGNYRRRS
jgi:hypothetical protein